MIHLDIVSFSSQTDIMELALNQSGPATERQLAIIDKNKDLYLRAVRQYGTDRVVKLGMKYCAKGRWGIINVKWAEPPSLWWSDVSRHAYVFPKAILVF